MNEDKNSAIYSKQLQFGKYVGERRMWDFVTITATLRSILIRLGYSPLATSVWLAALSGIPILLDRPSMGLSDAASPKGNLGS